MTRLNLESLDGRDLMSAGVAASIPGAVGLAPAAVRVTDITDGTSNTIMVGEVSVTTATRYQGPGDSNMYWGAR